MALIGYARVSTGDQNLSPQVDGLKAAGCTRIFEEHASGATRTRPQLAHALAAVSKGDTLLVARIDRLARSLSHLLEIVETLRARAHSSGRSAIPSTRPAPAAFWCCRCWARWRSSSGASFESASRRGSPRPRRGAGQGGRPACGSGIRPSSLRWPTASVTPG